MFSYAVIILICLIIPKNGIGIDIEMNIVGTVYCNFLLGDKSVKARLQGALIEVWEEETAYHDKLCCDPAILTDENGMFVAENIKDTETFSAPDPYIIVYHQCYTPSSKSQIKKGHQYATTVFLPVDENEHTKGKFDLEIKVGIAVSASMRAEGKQPVEIKKITTDIVEIK